MIIEFSSIQIGTEGIPLRRTVGCAFPQKVRRPLGVGFLSSLVQRLFAPLPVRYCSNKQNALWKAS
jgi:hypothetical protein